MDSKQRPLYCRGVAIGVVREPIEASLVDYPDVFAVSRERIDIVGNTYAEITAKMARVLQSLRYYKEGSVIKWTASVKLENLCQY